MMAQVGWAKVCEILAVADLPRDAGALDVRRFRLVIPGSLDHRERVGLARNYFELAGVEQGDEGEVFCLCGLEAEIPEGRKARPLSRIWPGNRQAFASAAAAFVLIAGTYGVAMMPVQ